VGILAIVMGIYFLINTGIQARRLALLDGKRLERRLSKASADQNPKVNSSPIGNGNAAGKS
jgi:hypothetical protein